MPARLRRLLGNWLAAAYPVPSRLRVALLRHSGVIVGPRVMIASGCRFEVAGCALGAGTYVNAGCAFETPTTLGERVFVGPGVLFVSSHQVADADRRAGDHDHRPIEVGDGAWIGARTVVLPGTTIGPGAVVAAGAVVTADCEGSVLHAGVPARPRRRLP